MHVYGGINAHLSRLVPFMATNAPSHACTQISTNTNTTAGRNKFVINVWYSSPVDLTSPIEANDVCHSLLHALAFVTSDRALLAL